MSNPTTINLVGDDGTQITLTPAEAPSITLGGALVGPQGQKGDTGDAGPPGGSSTQVQYNNTGALGGISGQTTDGTNTTFAGGSLVLAGASTGTASVQYASTALSGGTFTFPGINSTQTVAVLGNAQTFTADTTFSSINGNFGSSTVSSTYRLGYGATLSGQTKTVGIGTGGVSGSTTAINIGSAFGTTVTFNNLGSGLLSTTSGVLGLATAGTDYVIPSGSITGNAATATRWTTGRTLAITGDLSYTSPSFTGTGNVTAAGTLATVNSNVGSFTAANITVNAKGLVTAASNGTATITPAGSDTQVQYNNAGSLAADSSLTRNSAGTQFHIGAVAAGTPNATVLGQGVEIAGSDNSNGGMNLILSNSNTGVNAFTDLFLQNNLADATGTHFAVLNYNSSNYTYTGYGTIIAVPNQLALYGTDGPTTIGSASATGYVNVFVGGTATANEVARFTTTGLSLTAPLPVASGGTGSATQNFVDTSTTQTGIAGNKGWTGTHTYSGQITISAAANFVNGGTFRQTPTARTAGVTLGTTSTTQQTFDATSGAITVTMPSTASAGFTYLITKIDSTANPVMVVPASGGSLSGQPQINLVNQWDSVMLETTATAGQMEITSLNNLTLVSPSIGEFDNYNTVDQITNYERLYQRWSGNVAMIGTEAGGTGVATRSLSLRSGVTTTFTIAASGTSSGFYQFLQGSSASGAVGLISTGSWTASSGVNIMHHIHPTINQTGTAGYTALQINAIETATGSGPKLLFDGQVGGTSLFSIDDRGKEIRIVGNAASSVGTATLVAGTVTVSTTAVTANSIIFLTVQSLGTVTVASALSVGTKTAATSFVINSAVLTDTSVIGWQIIN